MVRGMPLLHNQGFFSVHPGLQRIHEILLFRRMVKGRMESDRGQGIPNCPDGATSRFAESQTEDPQKKVARLVVVWYGVSE
jgi:hypothetical protein